MVNRKTMLALCGGLLMVAVFAGVVRAQDEIGINAVNGKEYVCFFVTPLAVVNSGVSFGATGSLAIASYSGYGFYAAAAELFTGAYLSLNARVGATTGDIIIFIAGSSFAQMPLIAGTGALVVQYQTVYPLVFFGWEVEPGV